MQTAINLVVCLIVICVEIVACALNAMYAKTQVNAIAAQVVTIALIVNVAQDAKIVKIVKSVKIVSNVLNVAIVMIAIIVMDWKKNSFVLTMYSAQNRNIKSLLMN